MAALLFFPVSYTHLDVYKRQTWLFSRRENLRRGVWCDGEKIYVNGEEALAVRDIKLPGWHIVEDYMDAIGAVSYTHLDVYKRQDKLLASITLGSFQKYYSSLF